MPSILHIWLAGMVLVCIQAATAAQSLVANRGNLQFLSQAYSQNQADGYSFYGNPASLVWLKEMALAIHAERKFLLPELASQEILLATPMARAGLGVSLAYSGSASFNHMNISGAYARALGSSAMLGVEFNYHRLNMGSYGNTTVPGWGIAGLYTLTTKLTAGFVIRNLVGGRWAGLENEKLPAVLSSGFAVDLSERLVIGSQFILEEKRYPVCLLSWQYKVAKQVLIRGGCRTAPLEFHFGVGIHYAGFRLDIGNSFHPQLGITPGLGLIFQRANKKDDNQ